MKIVRLLTLSAIVAVIGLSSAMAAPVESVESSRASVALQKLDSFLGEQVVVNQLTALGISSEDARTRLAKLSDTEIEQLAAQVDLLQAGGKITGGNPHPLGPLGCVLHQICDFTCHLIHVIFCWDDIR